MHFLLIEDDKTILMILRELLLIVDQRARFTIFEMSSTAMKWLDDVDAGAYEDLPEIAIVDIRLPGVPGYEVAERIRKIPALSTIGIVLMTAYELSEEEYAEAIARAQADHFITKPLPSVSGLDEIIKSLSSIQR